MKPLTLCSVLLLAGVRATPTATTTSQSQQHLRGGDIPQRLLARTCPAVSFVGAFCPPLKEPVACFDGECVYDNVCFAIAAGVFEGLCQRTQSSVDDPPPDMEEEEKEDENCPVNLILPCAQTPAPVVCPNGCEYINICEAIGAGKFDCESAAVQAECPLPAEGSICGFIFLPVSCGSPLDCEYSNQCTADAAGFTTEDCVLVDQEDEEPALPVCPVATELTACDLNFMPVACGFLNCEYANLCNAEAAGFLQEDCRDVVEPTVEECVVINFIRACTDEPAAVVCGPLACEYDALCTAQAAGYTEADCVLLVTTDTDCPVATGMVPCPTILDPVKCGPNDCQYGSPCDAGVAGFVPETECKSVFDIPTPEPGSCPVTGPAISCINIPDPVSCGLDECEYTNLCLALGAGFKNEDCTFLNVPVLNEPLVCPETDPDRICGTIFNPVVCGGDACDYSNLCLAEGAGFAVDDCVQVEDDPPVLNPPIANELTVCPETDPDRICGTIFNPVVCGGNACDYSNLCLAEGAGFAVDDCVQVEDDPPAIPCPLPMDGLCILIFSPVSCNGCQYSNQCVADRAGFTEQDCEPVPF